MFRKKCNSFKMFCVDKLPYNFIILLFISYMVKILLYLYTKKYAAIMHIVEELKIDSCVHFILLLALLLHFWWAAIV